MPTPIPATIAAALLMGTAHAEPTDLVVHCDPPLAGPLRAIAAAFKTARLRVFPTPPNAIPEQLARDIQNDLIMTQPAILARIGASGHLGDFPPSATWRNRLVIAARRGSTPPPIDTATLAAPDPVWGGGPDGPAVLAAAGLRPRRILGAYDTEDARALLLESHADLALLHASELTPALQIVASPGLIAERRAVLAMNRFPRRPNPETLLRFLATPEATAILKAHGLEPVT